MGRLASVFIPIAALSACQPRSLCPLEVLENLTGVVVYTCSTQTKAEGATVRVPIEAGDSTVLINALGDARVSVSEIRNPDGNTILLAEDWYQADYNYTQGVMPLYAETTLNFPVQDDETPLQPGELEIDLIAIDEDGFLLADVPLQTTVHVKSDNDFQTGELEVLLYFVQSAASDTDVQDATQSAITAFSELLVPYGITPRVTSETLNDFDGSLQLMPPSFDEDNTYLPITEASGLRRFTIIVGDSIHHPEVEDGVHGIAGAIPGSLAAGNHSVVLVSWLSHAGPNASFNTGEIILMAETLAHESLHFMGLFHPTDQSQDAEEDIYDTFDNLADTEPCQERSTCETLLGRNIMFGYPVCDGIACIAQSELTEDQRGVMHRYAGAL